MTARYRPSGRDRLRVRLRRGLLERLRVVIEPDGTRLLDLGGGTGATTVRFGSGARELIVLEPDERKIARGRAAETPATFVTGVAETIPFGDARFDRVVSLMSFHHFSRPDEALREVARVLAPGGRLVVYDFDRSTLAGRWVSIFETRVHGHGLAFLTAADLERKVVASGLRAVRREPFGGGTLVVAER